jgi:hypothetical protein
MEFVKEDVGISPSPCRLTFYRTSVCSVPSAFSAIREARTVVFDEGKNQPKSQLVVDHLVTLTGEKDWE